jgi:AcrR family transcriptional regulator
MNCRKQAANGSHLGGARERLLDAASELAARDGYTHLTVERVLTAAGVSRSTFYQYFSNIDDCFWDAYRWHSEQLVSAVTAAARVSRHRELAVLDSLVCTAIAQPDIAQLVMREGLAAGRTGLAERDALIARLARAMTGSAAPQSRIDLPTATMIGGIFRFLSMRLADGGTLERLRSEVREWVQVFTQRLSRPSWNARFAPTPPRDASRSPTPWSGLRPRGAPRERILRGTAFAVRQQGYRDVTVADIVRAAGVSRRGFYREFRSKADAFIAAYEHAYERTVAACTPAFFGSGVWPERVWRSALAFTGFLSREPFFAYLGFVECYAIGPRFAPRVHDTQLAYTLFLEEGYRQRPEARGRSRACSALAAATIFEAGFQGSRHGLSLRRLQPLAVFIALTPFIGIDEAGAFVSGKSSWMGASAPAPA